MGPQSFLMITPDFGSASFPHRSASLDAPIAKTFKRARFARQPVINKFEIPSRHCRLQLPVGTEALQYRVRQLQREVQLEQTIVDLRSRVEHELHQQNAEYDSPTERSILHLKKEIEALKEVKTTLDDTTDRMKMDILRLKGLREKRPKIEGVQSIRSLANLLWSALQAETVTGSPPRSCI